MHAPLNEHFPQYFPSESDVSITASRSAYIFAVGAVHNLQHAAVKLFYGQTISELIVQIYMLLQEPYAYVRYIDVRKFEIRAKYKSLRYVTSTSPTPQVNYFS